MRVEVSGKQFVFPRTCACCGQFATTTMALTGSEQNRKALTRGWRWDVPHCTSCKRHVVLAERGILLVLLLSAASLLSASILGLLTGQWQVGFATYLIAQACAVLTCWLWFRRLKSACHVNCTSISRSVNYLGANRDCHAFEIHNWHYAKEFIASNHRKIVNASTDVANVLRNYSFGDYQVPRRLLRKKR
jgi:hypothetical protein